MANAKKEIKGFFKGYRFLSNYHVASVKYLGVIYNSSEHAYQAAKATNATDHDYVALAPTCGAARRRGQEITAREDWDEVKYRIMEEVVRAKFEQHPDLLLLLQATGTAYLEETNYWHDNTWGTCTCDACQHIRGKNWLGEILMKVREEHQMLCMHCHEEITPENNGISINDGEFYQCDDCHYNEFGVHIAPIVLVYKV